MSHRQSPQWHSAKAAEDGEKKQGVWVYFKIKTISPGTGDIHYKDKLVIRLSYIYDGKSYTGKGVYIINIELAAGLSHWKDYVVLSL